MNEHTPHAKPEALRNIIVDTYEPSPAAWDSVRADVAEIENSVFGEAAFDELSMERDFTDPETVAVMARDQHSGKIIGFTYAQPAEKVYAEFDDDYADRNPTKDTAYISDTAIAKEYQNRRILPLLIQRLEEELLKRGYEYIERDSANRLEAGAQETYADVVRRNYSGRILEEKPHIDEELGPQVFFRIRLRKNES